MGSLGGKFSLSVCPQGFKRILELLQYKHRIIDQVSEVQTGFSQVNVLTFLESRKAAVNKVCLWSNTLSIQLEVKISTVTPSPTAQKESCPSTITENYMHVPKIVIISSWEQDGSKTRGTNGVNPGLKSGHLYPSPSRKAGRQQILLSSAIYSTQNFSELDDAHPHWGGQSTESN